MSSAKPISDLRALRHCADETIQGIAWPTVAISIGAVSGFLIAVVGAVAGVIPIWAAVLINVVSFFVAYTGFHEATHRNYHGRLASADWLNDLFGHVLGFIMLYPFSMHSFIHLTHHSNTNDPDMDPDRWMRGRSFAKVAGRGLTLAYHYWAFTVAKKSAQPDGARFFRRLSLEAAPSVIALVALIAFGHWQVALVVWFGGLILAVALLGACFDWVVHHPHDDRSLLGGTRTFLAPAGWRRVTLNWLHLFQNYHIIHHINPRAPFYAYEGVFLKGEDFLRRAGAKVVDL
ncbi:MAG: fatty acid desaturase [Pseudomonadota bacterium]